MTGAPDLAIHEHPVNAHTLARYARVSIAFEVRHRLDPRTGALWPVPQPWRKDYDVLGPPAGWLREFDVSRWRILSAEAGGAQVGGAVLAWRTPGVDLLGPRRDRVVVWDIRVLPQARGAGVGRALWHAATGWAQARGARELLVETQDVNASACRFYQAMGCELAEVNADVYRDFPDELQVLWRQALARRAPAP